jgi:hypothetical protein
MGSERAGTVLTRGGDGLVRWNGPAPAPATSGALKATQDELERVTRDRDGLRAAIAGRPVRDTLNSPASQLRRHLQHMTEGIGVGFWNKDDALTQAKAEEARTGRPHALHMESTNAGTHALWFVRRVEQEVAA